MRYVVTLESPDMKVVLDALNAELTALHLAHQEARRDRGPGSPLACQAYQAIMALERGIKALKDAVSKAVPERAIERAEPVMTGFQDYTDRPAFTRTVAPPRRYKYRPRERL